MGWWHRLTMGMWSGSSKWLPISQIGLCIAMGASRISVIARGGGDGVDVTFAIGWGVLLCLWLLTLAGFLVIRRRIDRAQSASETDG